MKRTKGKWIKVAAALVTTLSLTACGSSPSNAQDANGGTGTKGPVQINLGAGFASEEPLWIMQVDPSLAPHEGKSYTLKLTQFRANQDRLNAYQAGQVVGGTLGEGAAMMTAAQGVPLKVVASVVKDTPGTGFNNEFLSLKDSGIKSVADLKGKTIGIPDFKSPSDMWARAAIESAGLNPSTDVKYAVIPIPAMLNAVESKKIDVGMLPQPFATTAEKSGKFTQVFTSKTGVPVDEDFLIMFMNPDFISKNKDAVKDFLSDYVGAVKYYLQHGSEVRKTLIDKGFVKADPSTYVNMTDYNRAANGKVDLTAWNKVNEIITKEGWLDKKVDANQIVDMSLLPNN